jgi:alkylation response protein AidB-like acyl-CoA dehydrogenase
MLYRLAWLRATGEPTALESAMTKLHISEAFVQTSLDALQIHGGSGYMTDAEFERDVRDAIASRIYSGTSEIQRTIVARRLGL